MFLPNIVHNGEQNLVRISSLFLSVLDRSLPYCAIPRPADSAAVSASFSTTSSFPKFSSNILRHTTPLRLVQTH